MWGPRLEDSVVALRPIAESEWPLLVEWSADAEVLRFAGIAYAKMAPAGLICGYHAMAPEATRKWCADPNALHWGLDWHGRLVGRTGIHHIDWHARRGWTATLVGDKSVWRHGIATAAVALRTECAFRQLNLHKVNLAYVDGDMGSARVQRRAGYREIARLKEQLYRDGRWFDEIRTELLREDWERERPSAGPA